MCRHHFINQCDFGGRYVPQVDFALKVHKILTPKQARSVLAQTRRRILTLARGIKGVPWDSGSAINSMMSVKGSRKFTLSTTRSAYAAFSELAAQVRAWASRTPPNSWPLNSCANANRPI